MQPLEAKGKPTLASAPAKSHGPAAPGTATQAPPWAAGLALALQRIAGLHAALADAYGDLAAEGAAGLAVLPDLSLHASVPAPAGLLTPKQTAELLGVHPRTLRRMELSGEIPPAIGEGKGKRWRREDFGS